MLIYFCWFLVKTKVLLLFSLMAFYFVFQKQMLGDQIHLVFRLMKLLETAFVQPVSQRITMSWIEQLALCASCVWKDKACEGGVSKAVLLKSTTVSLTWSASGVVSRFSGGTKNLSFHNALLMLWSRAVVLVTAVGHTGIRTVNSGVYWGGKLPADLLGMSVSTAS